MADNELRELFSQNLKYWLSKRSKTQTDLRKYMNVSSATASDWCNGKKIPRTDKIQVICGWLGIELDDLLTDKSKEQKEPGYYLNPETAALAQEMFDDPQMRSLFHMKRTMEPEKFQAHFDMMKKLYQMEHPEEDDDFTGC